MDHVEFHRLKKLDQKHPDILCGCTSSRCYCGDMGWQEHLSRYGCRFRQLMDVCSNDGERHHAVEVMARRYDESDMLAPHILDPVTDHKGHAWCHAWCEASTRASAVREGQKAAGARLSQNLGGIRS
jgi:hypothetical protein